MKVDAQQHKWLQKSRVPWIFQNVLTESKNSISAFFKIVTYPSLNQIGGHSFTILLDCESQYLHDRLVLRGGSGNDRIDDNIHAIKRKLEFFAKNTLPLLKSIEDEDKLIVVSVYS